MNSVAVATIIAFLEGMFCVGFAHDFTVKRVVLWRFECRPSDSDNTEFVKHTVRTTFHIFLVIKDTRQVLYEINFY